jgi:acetyl esterase/lipase
MPEDRSVLTREGPPPSRSWAYGTDPDNVIDGYLPADVGAQGSGAPVALVHGGFWRPDFDRGHLRPMAAALAAAGHPTALLEYRRIPADPDAALADVSAGLRTVVESLGPPVVVGHSAGGHLAILAAVEAGLTCLALAPVADLALAERLDLDGGAVVDFLGQAAAQRPDLDPAGLEPPLRQVTVVHGASDSVVPAAVAESFCDRTRARLVLLPDTGHFELIDPLSAAWPAVLSEVDARARTVGIE